MRLDEITREAVDAWMGRMLLAGTGRPTVNNRLKVFRMMLNYAIDNDVIHRDPTRRIKKIPTDIRAARTVTREEETRLLDACETPEERAQILLALDAGLRWGEVAGLALDAITGDYLVVRQVVERSTRTVRGYPKGKKPRVVPIATDRLREALAVVALLAEPRGSDALVFVTIKADGDARPIDASIWRNNIWRRLCSRSKVNPRGTKRRLTFHDLRHTYGTRLAAAGVPRSEIAALMGHADEKTTAIYIHPGTDGHRLDLVTRALAMSE
jgi:integrase